MSKIRTSNKTDLLLKRALANKEAPDPILILRVKSQLAKEEPVLRKPTTARRSVGIIAAATAAFLLLSTAVFAAVHFLKPSQVAEKFEDIKLSAAFEGENAVNINESVTSGDYTFTLLGAVTGKGLTDSPYNNAKVELGRTYAVLAIQKADGSPMPKTQEEGYTELSFFASPLVKGLKPWDVNIITMNGNYFDTVVEGILYRLVECDEIAIFADRGLYFAVSDSTFYDTNAFSFNETTGELAANPGYNGASAVFTLPLDKKMSDPARAQQYLDELNKAGENSASQGSSSESTDYDSIDWDKATPIESTRKVLTIAKDGMFTYSFEIPGGNGAGGSESLRFDAYFTDAKKPTSIVTNVTDFGLDNGKLYGVCYALDEKGILTGVLLETSVR